MQIFNYLNFTPSAAFCIITIKAYSTLIFDITLLDVR